MRPSIAITGVAGLIGSNLAYKFIELGYNVLGIDNFIGGYESNLPTNRYFTYYKVDILDQKRLSYLFNLYKPETVIHCAALAHEGLSVFAPKTITENIYAGTISVATAAIAAEVKTFINTSSMARYGNIQPPFRESDEVNPIDPYGMAKYHAEQQLNLLHDIHGIEVYHMVPHNVGGVGQCYSDPFRNVVSIFTNRIIHNKPIYIYGDGQQKRSFSHVDDCVDAFVTLLQRKHEIKSGNVFNIGPSDGTEVTIKELADIVYSNFNTEKQIVHLPDRPREVKNAWVSTDKAQKILDYKTKYDDYTVIRDTVNWIKKQPLRDFNYHLDLEIINKDTPKTWTDRLFNK